MNLPAAIPLPFVSPCADVMCDVGLDTHPRRLRGTHQTADDPHYQGFYRYFTHSSRKKTAPFFIALPPFEITARQCCSTEYRIFHLRVIRTSIARPTQSLWRPSALLPRTRRLDTPCLSHIARARSSRRTPLTVQIIRSRYLYPACTSHPRSFNRRSTREKDAPHYKPRCAAVYHPPRNTACEDIQERGSQPVDRSAW
jgi:hypothetical protein